MTVKELIDTLEEMPLDYPVVVDNVEVTEVLIRDEMYLSSEHGYNDGIVIKIY